MAGQCARFIGETGLSPIDPKAELQPMPVCVVGVRRSCRKARTATASLDGSGVGESAARIMGKPSAVKKETKTRPRWPLSTSRRYRLTLANFVTRPNRFQSET